jgi:hypothetical protein
MDVKETDKEKYHRNQHPAHQTGRLTNQPVNNRTPKLKKKQEPFQESMKKQTIDYQLSFFLGGGHFVTKVS